MAEWVRGFIAPDVMEVHRLWAGVLESAERLEVVTRRSGAGAAAAARLAQLRAGYVDFNNELRVTAAVAAAEAVRGARERLAATQVRPDTGETPHLRDLIVAAPIPTGAVQTGMVGVGLISELDRAINRNSPGYGPYWRAQEYGTGSDEVESQIGRVIFGAFAKAGGADATRPLAEYAGGGGGPHPIFLTNRPAYLTAGTRPSGSGGTRGGDVGWGTIGAEIQPRRFLALGADAGAVLWRSRMALVKQQALDRLAAISVT